MFLLPDRKRPHKLALFLLSFSFFTLIFLYCCWFFLSPLHVPSYFLGPGRKGRRNSAIETQSDSRRPDNCNGSCDIGKGRWVPDPNPPLYTNETCPYMQFNQNCLSNARPDRDYLHWKWQPYDCELERFDPRVFLQMLKGKKVAFVGDSLARNQMQALLCALAQVEDPRSSSDVPEGNLWNEKEYQWHFSSHNFTLGNIWSRFLVNHREQQNVFHLDLDVPDVAWSSRIADYDVVVFSTAYWYFRRSVYYLNNMTLGTTPGSGVNLTTFDILPAMRVTWETVWKHMANKHRGVSFLRTVTVPHFGEHDWNDGGKCNRTQPDFDPHLNLSLPWMTNEMYKVQIEEFNKALASLAPEDNLRLKLIDVTYSAFLRPDGHPSIYRIRNRNEPISDCLHWCMPGPIDTWNEMLLHTLRSCYVNASAMSP